MAENSTSFKVGHQKIEGSGARAGQKRRSTAMVHALFDFFEDKQPDLDKAWYGLNEKEKWDTYCKCLKFMVPSIQAITFDQDQTVSSIQELVKKMATTYKSKE